MGDALSELVVHVFRLNGLLVSTGDSLAQPAGQRVRASRSRRSSISAWGTSIRKVRTSLSERSGPVMGLVSLLRSRLFPVWRVGRPYDRMLSSIEPYRA